jgi:hypothetical protein
MLHPEKAIMQRLFFDEYMEIDLLSEKSSK